MDSVTINFVDVTNGVMMSSSKPNCHHHWRIINSSTDIS